MTKFEEILQKLNDNQEARQEMIDILQGQSLTSVSEEQLTRLTELAQKMGVDLSVAELKNVINPPEGEISDDDLDAVAGGSIKRPGLPLTSKYSDPEELRKYIEEIKKEALGGK